MMENLQNFYPAQARHGTPKKIEIRHGTAQKFFFGSGTGTARHENYFFAGTARFFVFIKTLY